MRVLIAGDLVARERVDDLFMRGDYQSVFGDICDLVRNYDTSIVNLEAPIVTSPQCRPINKCGPHLKSHTAVLAAIEYVGFDTVTLANNHLRDYGDLGVSDTLYCLSQEGISYVGAGLNLDESKIVLYKSTGDGVLAVINCCENEFSIAGKAKAGANPINPVSLYHSIKDAKNKADYILVIVHGGHEFFNLPSPRMKEFYRFLIDLGADAVVNHHQHCFSGYEVYKGKPIFYGLGNLSFDRIAYRNHPWNHGYMVGISFDKESVSFTLFPYKQGDDLPGVVLLSEDAKEDFYRQISLLNSIINDDEKLCDVVRDYYTKCMGYELWQLEPIRGKLFAKLTQWHLLPSLLSRKRVAGILNHVQCESHRDRLIYALEEKCR